MERGGRCNGFHLPASVIILLSRWGEEDGGRGESCAALYCTGPRSSCTFFLSMYNCTPCIFFFSKPFPLPLPLCSRHPSFHRNAGVMTLPVRSGISASALVDSFHFTHKASPSYLGLVLKKKKKKAFSSFPDWWGVVAWNSGQLGFSLSRSL